MQLRNIMKIITQLCKVRVEMKIELLSTGDARVSFRRETAANVIQGKLLTIVPRNVIRGDNYWYLRRRNTEHSLSEAILV